MVQTLFILNDPSGGSERSDDALRLAGALARREGEQVGVFLMGHAASCAERNQKVPPGYCSLELMLGNWGGGTVERSAHGGAAWTREVSQTPTSPRASTPARSTTLAARAQWAERTLVFRAPGRRNRGHLTARIDAETLGGWPGVSTMRGHVTQQTPFPP